MKGMNLRSSFVVTLLLALVIPILAACGGGTPAAPSGSTTTAATTAPVTAAATSAPVAAATTAPTAAPTAAATAAPAATAAATEAAATSAATETSVTGNVLRIGEAVFPDSLDPEKSSYSNEIAVEILNYEGLTRLDKDLKVVPAAAEKWDVNKDATQFTFHLRDNLKYSDGSPLTSKDFAYAVYHSLDPHNPGDYQSTYFMIKGAQDIIDTNVPTDEGKLDNLRKTMGVETPDDKTIKFTLSQPTPFFPTIAGIWTMYPAKEDLVTKGGESWWQDPANQLGNGPFQITKIDQTAKVIDFKANANYWAGKPKLDGIEIKYIDDLAAAFQAYKNNEVDVFTPDVNDVPSIRADAALSKEYKEYTGANTTGFEFNLARPPFDKLLVREAFAYAFDRDSFNHDVLKDTFAKTLTWIPPGYPGYDPNEKRWDFDPAKAKALLAQAGYPNGNGMPEIKLTYASNNPANQTRSEYLAQMYQKNLGVKLILDPVESTTFTDLKKKPETYPQLSRGGWNADYPDQSDWLSIYWHSRTPFAKNISYKNDQADKLMDQADQEPDATKRAGFYDQAQKLIVGDVPIVFYGNAKNFFLIKPYVKGLDFTPQDSDFPGEITGFLNTTLQK